MKKILLSLLSLSLALSAGANGLSMCDSLPCRVVITSGFESECLQDEKGGVRNEYPEEVVACRQSKVVYTVRPMSGTVVASCQWTVSGAEVYGGVGDRVTVEWGDGEWGLVTVVVANASGDTCTGSLRVRLVAVPEAGAVTVPAYIVASNGHKVIRVCQGADVRFEDNSDAGDSDIAGWQWSGDYSPSASTRSYTIENVTTPGRVIHKVYNNCGCYDREDFYIEVYQGDVLELDCYGTVCQNAVVTYRATHPVCSDYRWYVEGGTLVDGQGTSTPTVQWDRPQNGHGVLGLDAAGCGDLACPVMMEKRIPVIQDSLDIEGPTELCVGESALFSLPLFGSTEYRWSISPSAGVDTLLVNSSHEASYTFTAPGTYRIHVQYLCGFLGCGPYLARPLEVTVLPELEISGESRLCITHASQLTLTPAVAATWIISDAAGLPVDTVRGQATLAYTFPAPGFYSIAATMSGYCASEPFVLEVQGAPPAPTVADLDPANRHVCCPYWGLTLKGTPANPSYSLVWDPVCATATPHDYHGDSVTVNYQAEVCDVRVYHYDRTLQCLSDAYVHTVDVLELEPVDIPHQLTVCPGTTVDWTHGEIPDQSSDGVLYEWKLQWNRQNRASVQGDHLRGGITFTVHKMGLATDQFYMVLTRTSCLGAIRDTFHITVLNSITGNLSISGPGSLCLGDTGLFTASGGVPAHGYQWEVDDTPYAGSSVSHAFDETGPKSVFVYNNPYDYCSNHDYYNSADRVVTVNPLPPAQYIDYDRTLNILSVQPPLPSGYSFAWYNSQTPPQGMYTMPMGTSATLSNSVTNGFYCCVVTDLATGCSKVLDYEVGPEIPSEPCDTFALTASYDLCPHVITAYGGGSGLLTWGISGGGHGSFWYPQPNTYGTASVVVTDAGTYTVTARTVGTCSVGIATVTVPFVPDFEFITECDKVRIVNHSKYLNGNSQIYIKAKKTDLADSATFHFSASQTSYLFTPPSGWTAIDFILESVGGVSANHCPLGSAEVVTVPTVQIVTVDSLPPHRACDNTPLLLTAVTTPARPVLFSEWAFGDGSSFDTLGGSICHTFAKSGNGQNQYSVTVIITDEYGCRKSSPSSFEIQSAPDPLINGVLWGNIPACPGNPIAVTFDPPVANTYRWTNPGQSPVLGPNPHSAYYSGDYRVIASNINHCVKEATTFVSFLNAVVADIYSERDTVCVGYPVTLYGDAGAGSGIVYDWTLTGPGTNLTFSTPNVTFTPTAAGTYQATLMVSNPPLCPSSVAAYALVVVPEPSAPMLSFGTNSCLGNGPVDVTASGFSGQMHWSTGATGVAIACPYPGTLEGWYVDPALACPSGKGSIYINRQPDFDALLTGCYEKCSRFFDYTLPVYGFSSVNQVLQWEWLLDNIRIASGQGGYSETPLELPLTRFGSYALSVEYSPGCVETSPSLFIDRVNLCPCDSIEATVTNRRMTVSGCRFYWDIEVEICNHSSNNYCIGDLEAVEFFEENVGVLSLSVSQSNLPANGCIYAYISVEVLTLEPQLLTIRNDVSNQECGCSLEFTVDLTPAIECERQMTLKSLDLNQSLTNPAAAWFDISLLFPYGTPRVFSVRSNPPMVVDWVDDGMGKVDILGMFDAGQLSQLSAENGYLCIEVLACHNDSLCCYVYCYKARNLYEEYIGSGLATPVIRGTSDDKDEARVTVPKEGPSLLPNPATGEVAVVADGEVMEISLMDMHGRRLRQWQMTKGKRPLFDVGAMPSGPYIVRVTVAGGDNTEVSYLKLVVTH